nr:phage holin family protein [Palleronia marisminoris]
MRGQIRDTGGLLSDALQQVVALVRGELNLLRAEMDENVRKAVAAIGMIIAGVVIMLVALNVLAAALVEAITELGLEAGWAALLVGVVFAIIAAILAAKGTNNLKVTSLAPTRTTKNVERDGEAVKKAL